MQSDIKALRQALAAGPTPGPWHAYVHPLQPAELNGRVDVVGAHEDDDVAENATRENALFIAAASPDRIARLLDALELAHKELDEIHQGLTNPGWFTNGPKAAHMHALSWSRKSAERRAAMKDAP